MKMKEIKIEKDKKKIKRRWKGFDIFKLWKNLFKEKSKC